MWLQRNCYNTRIPEFFFVAMSNDSLMNHYTLNFELMYHHDFSLTELNNMLPYERAIYLDLLNGYLEKKHLEEQQRINTNG